METEVPKTVRVRFSLSSLLLSLVTIVGALGMAYAHTVAKPMAEKSIPVHRVSESREIERFSRPDPELDSETMAGGLWFSVSKRTSGDEWVRVTTWDNRKGWIRRSDLETRSVRIRGGSDR